MPNRPPTDHLQTQSGKKSAFRFRERTVESAWFFSCPFSFRKGHSGMSRLARSWVRFWRFCLLAKSSCPVRRVQLGRRRMGRATNGRWGRRLSWPIAYRWRTNCGGFRPDLQRAGCGPGLDMGRARHMWMWRTMILTSHTPTPTHTHPPGELRRVSR